MPADVVEQVSALAADGWSLVGIASRLGVAKATFDCWRREDPAIDAAIDVGRENERRALHNKLYRAAMEGEGKDSNIAAMFLLKARHGYREGEPVGDSGRVNVNITLPGATPLEKFIEVTNADGTETQRLPIPGPVVTRGG